jgi:hypothetical protein
MRFIGFTDYHFLNAECIKEIYIDSTESVTSNIYLVKIKDKDDREYLYSKCDSYEKAAAAVMRIIANLRE